MVQQNDSSQEITKKEYNAAHKEIYVMLKMLARELREEKERTSGQKKFIMVKL